mgnify:CR=1 FL=1
MKLEMIVEPAVLFPEGLYFFLVNLRFLDGTGDLDLDLDREFDGDLERDRDRDRDRDREDLSFAGIADDFFKGRLLFVVVDNLSFVVVRPYVKLFFLSTGRCRICRAT